MFASKHFPERLLPRDLDMYLSKGWYRMGQTIFTTHFLTFEDSIFSAIWIRLPLQKYQFRKSLRKLFKINTDRFRVETGSMALTDEKENLYKVYRQDFKGRLSPSLHDSLMDGGGTNIYNTYEVRIYDGDRLIATSFFDLGETSAASIVGIYDPEYKMYSLGFFTMLCEIDFCLQHDLQYYYPGYVVPGYERFDYKLRIGEVEFYDLAQRKWMAYPHLGSQGTPMQVMSDQLKGLKLAFEKKQLDVSLKLYPFFEANLIGYWPAPYLDFPVMLWVDCFVHSTHFLFVVYDLRISAFRVLWCAPLNDLQFFVNEAHIARYDPAQYFLQLVMVEKIELNSSNMDDVIASVQRLISN